jgi:hypothetical protein
LDIRSDIAYWEEKENFFQCIRSLMELSKKFAALRQADGDDFNLALTIRHYVPKDPRPQW